MTAKERARLRGFWTHKGTGEYIAITRVTVTGEVYFYKVNYTGHKAGPQEIMLLRDLKEEYVKGMR
ncbi:hypothetical protein [Bacillus bingmayongensis]|uniref:hypothetical protein n=1 Tax=Bacillus bingmayongensis TaxID=1150157 RepID=UPI001C8E9C5B|nr:hypothetical protein [Bacillus bingmayongensis]MBY0597717.1 hypothetical protein [Bacillus bingmayongensis]